MPKFVPVAARGGMGADPQRAERVSSRDVGEMVDFYKGNNISIADAARRFGIPEGTAKKIIRAADVSRPPGRTTRSRDLDRVRPDIRRLYAEGLSPSAIAERVGVNGSTAARIVADISRNMEEAHAVLHKDTREKQWRDLEECYRRSGRAPKVGTALHSFEQRWLQKSPKKIKALRIKCGFRSLADRCADKWTALERVYASGRAMLKTGHPLHTFQTDRSHWEPERLAALRYKYGIETQREKVARRWVDFEKSLADRGGRVDWAAFGDFYRSRQKVDPKRLAATLKKWRS